MATKTKEAPAASNGVADDEVKMRQIAFQGEMMMRTANLLMQSLSVGGPEVKPLFDKEQRAILEEKLYGILKVL
jgi:hypothetical protein